MSSDQTTTTDPRTGPWRVQSSVWHKGKRSAYVMTTPSSPMDRGALVARVYVAHPDGECDSARAVLPTLAVQVAAAPVLIAPCAWLWAAARCPRKSPRPRGMRWLRLAASSGRVRL